MITQSFVFLEGVTPKREQRIWQQGVNDWNDFLQFPFKGLAAKRKIKHELQIKQAERALHQDKFDFFLNNLPRNQQWRLFDKLKHNLVYLDIETSGYYGDITVVGLYDGNQSMAMVRGQNLDKELFKKTLSQYTGIVTFNGSSFDLPILKRYFGVDFSNFFHIDLRHVCAKLDLHGGLKHIERTLGIRRAKEVANVTGEDAVLLWHKYRATGNKKYLDLLVQYNEEDILNLKPLAEQMIPRLWKEIHNV